MNPDHLITLVCKCGIRHKWRVSNAIWRLRHEGCFGFGQHVTDPCAIVLRAARLFKGWVYLNGEIGKSTVTIVCDECLTKVRVEALKEQIVDDACIIDT